MKHLNSTIECIRDLLVANAPEKVRTDVNMLLGDLCDLQAIYVAAKVSHLRQLSGREPAVLAKSLFDDWINLEDARLDVVKEVSGGRVQEVVNTLAKQDKIAACAIVAMAEDFVPGTAKMIAQHCQKVYQNADKIGSQV